MKKNIIQGFVIFLLLLMFFSQILKVNAQIVNTNPCLNFRETDKTLPLGLWRVCVGDDQFAIQQNTASNGSFGTLTTVLSVTGGVVTFLGGTSGGGSSVFANDIYLDSTGIGTGVRAGKGPNAVTTNTVFGDSAMVNISTGKFNTVVGYSSLQNCTTCSYNTAFGTQNMYYLGTGNADPFGDRNSSFGYAALTNCGLGGAPGTCYSNSGFGFAVLSSIQTGAANSAFGDTALRFNIGGSYNTAMGFASNRAVGNYQSYNSSFGSQSLYNNIADNNAAFGFAGMISNTTGTQNAALGSQVMYYNTTGSYLTGMGFFGGSFLADGTTPCVTTQTSVFLGAYSRCASADNGSNEISIGYQASAYSSNSVTLGNSAILNWVPGANNITDLGANDRTFKKGWLTTVVGGSAVNGNIIVQSTSGVGTTDSIQLRVGNNGATLALIANTSGVTTNIFAATRGTFGLLGASITNSLLSVGSGSGASNDLSISSGTAYGSLAEPSIAITGNSTSVIGHYIFSTTVVSGGATLTNQYGAYIDAIAKSGAGTTTTATGLYVNLPTAGTTNYAAQFAGLIVPSTNNTIDLGTTTLNWRTGYLVSVNINTSGTGGSFNHTGKHFWTGGTAEIATGNALCQATTSEVQVNAATTCLVSSKRYKHDDRDISLSDAKNVVFKLRPIDYIFNGQDNKGRRFGFFAEDAATIDKRLVEYDELGRPNSFRYEEYTSVLTKVIQDMEKRILKLEKK